MAVELSEVSAPARAGYVEREVQRDGRKIYTRDYPGAEPAIVLMHGFPDCLDLYDSLVQQLAGRRVVTFDFIGWGRSDKAPGNRYTYENLERDLDAVVQALQLKGPDLVAHDASGPPAIEWALRNPDRVGHLVLLNCFYMITLRLRPPEGVLLYMLPGIRYLAHALNAITGRRLNKWLYRWQLRRFLRDESEKSTLVPRLYAGWITSWPAFRDLVGRLLPRCIRYAFPGNMARLRSYQGRVRIVFGARDPYLNLHVAQSFHRAFPNSDLFLLPRGYHYVQADEPAGVGRLILELREPPGGALVPVRRREPAQRSPGRVARWRGRLLAVSRDEVLPETRGFPPMEPAVREQVVRYFHAFLDGYHLAAQTADLDTLASRLDVDVEPELRGFAYEGAGMAHALLDHLTPWNRTRLREFVSGPARPYEVITLIGEGFAVARLPWARWGLRGLLERRDPGFAWFVVDGYGFHEGFFHHQRFLFDRRRPGGLGGFAARVFDQGLGRALWFVAGGDPQRIADVISGFEPTRQADLWSGIGLACSYAGGIHPGLGRYSEVIDSLASRAGAHRPEVGLGAMFAADTRYRAGTPSPWTSLACERLAGMSWEEAGRLVASVGERTRHALIGRSRSERLDLGYELARRTLAASVKAAPRG